MLKFFADENYNNITDEMLTTEAQKNTPERICPNLNVYCYISSINLMGDDRPIIQYQAIAPSIFPVRKPATPNCSNRSPKFIPHLKSEETKNTSPKW